MRGDLEEVLRSVTEAAAHAMMIDRVNIWLFADEGSKIRCIEFYDRVHREHSSGGIELTAADYPAYFRALEEERTIVAHDAQADPRTREFAEGYLDVHGITSMLDAPLHSGGDVIGIICHEHVGTARVWTEEEQRFAGSLADLASLALESRERLQAEGALRRSERLTHEIMTKALDAIIIVDEGGTITHWNPRAETVFGWSREEAIGQSLYDTVIPPRFHDDHRRGLARYLETGEGPIIDRRIEVTARDKSGREFPAELGVSPVRIGGALSFGAFVRDITDRVRAELEVHQLNAQLEERVQERTAQLRAAVEEKENLLEELQRSSVELVERLVELEHKSETIRSDLERAQTIQTALLPDHPPELEDLHVDVLYRPGMNVGGDLYDLEVLEDGRLALYVADAAGHGVAAAMLSVLFKQRLRIQDSAGDALAPAEVLRRVNRQLADDEASHGLFLTVGYVLYDPRTREVRAASAGHTPMLLHRASGENSWLERTGPALGLARDSDYTEHRFTIARGDRLFLYTDGLIDGIERTSPEELLELLEPALEEGPSDGPERLRRLFDSVDDRTRSNGTSVGRDDMTLLVLEAAQGPCRFDNDPGDRSPAEASAPSTDGASPWTLWIAETKAETQLAIRGPGTWMHCETFRRLGQAALDAKKQLSVDLSGCTYLDSTFLGTLHELVSSDPGSRIVIRGASPSVRELFGELGLDDVLESVREGPCRAPCEPVPVTQEAPARESQERLLRAHEILSELSEENRARFAHVVQALRAELGAVERSRKSD